MLKVAQGATKLISLSYLYKIHFHKKKFTVINIAGSSFWQLDYYELAQTGLRLTGRAAVLKVVTRNPVLRCY